MARVRHRGPLYSIKAALITMSIAVTVLVPFYLSFTNSRRQGVRIFRTRRPRLIIFVGILSKRSEIDRRNSIRATWLTLCQEQRGVECKFFTDKEGEHSQRYMEEQENNSDLVFMPYSGGHNFGLRLVWIMQWAHRRFDFDYFLRIDDDHFLCMDRLLYELPRRPTSGLYWGYIHCREYVVRVDEGWLLLSSDLVLEALDKLNTSLPCHPYGDQAVALWMGESKINVTYFYDNDRIIHTATSFHPAKYMQTDICQKYLSLHGTYPKSMKKYWILVNHLYFLRKAKRTLEYNVPRIEPFEKRCEYSKHFYVDAFLSGFRFYPKPCKDNPVWEGPRAFQSREELGGVLA